MLEAILILLAVLCVFVGYISYIACRILQNLELDIDLGDDDVE